MIVQCPSCASRYRIRDANIPPTGGKIRCPSCSHSFVVYPEAAGGDDEDKTSITSQDEIGTLVNQMASKMGGGAGMSETGEDFVATQVAGSDLDKLRAMQAMKNELGDPMDMDGTVEIKNPMDVWQQAQAALQSARGAASAPDESEDGYDHAATEVVNPNNLNLPFATGGGGSAPHDEEDATFQMSRDKIAAIDPMNKKSDSQGDSSPGVDPSGLGSGVHPYAQNTPPSGQQPGQGASANARPSAPPIPKPSIPQPSNPAPDPPSAPNHGFDRKQSPSGLHASDLFADELPETIPGEAPAGPGSNGMGMPPTPDFGSGPSGPAAGPGSAPADSGPQQPPGGGGGAKPNPDHPGPWKLKTNFGLTYEFPDTRGLKSWLSNREELDGYMLSGDDGANYYPLSDFPQLERGGSGSRPAMPSGNFSVPPSHGSGLNSRPPGLDSQPSPFDSGLNQPRPGPGPNPTGPNPMPPRPNNTMKGPRVDTEYRPPSRENKYRGLLWLVFFLLLLVAVAIGLQTFGVMDIKGPVEELILGKKQEPAATQQQAPAANTPAANEPAEKVDPKEAEKERAAEVENLLRDVERLIEGNKLPAALEKIDTILTIDPEEPRVFDLKADVHERLGQADEAATAEKKAEELRAAEKEAEGAPAEDGAEPDPEGEDAPTESDENAE